MKRLLLYAWLLLALMWGLVSCAPRTIVVEPIAPRAVQVHEQVKAAAVSSSKAVTATESVKAQAGTIADEVNKAFAEVDRLKKSDITPEKYDPIVAMLTGLKGHSQILIVSSTEADRRAREAEKAAITASDSSAALVPIASKADAAVVDMTIKTAASQSDAEKWRAMRNTLILMAVAAVVFFLLWLFVKLRPLIPL